MEFTSNKISTLQIDGKAAIVLIPNELSSIIEEYHKLKGCEKLKIKVEKYREKRSKDANRYAWELMSKIAEAISTSKEAVYEEMLQRYGANAMDEDGNIIIVSFPTNAKLQNVDIHRAYYDTQYMSDGSEVWRYRLIKGSSLYDTTEMSRLIDGIVSEAQELDIQTMTPDELRQIKERWGV